MTTLRKAIALFLSFILFDNSNQFCFTAYGMLCLYTNLDLYRSIAMSGRLTHFWDLLEWQPCPGSVTTGIGRRAGIP